MRPGITAHRAALALGGASLAFHVVYAGLIALVPEEAYYWDWSRHLDLSYYDHPPLTAWSIAASSAIFGASERAIRLPAAVYGGLFLAFLFLTGRRLFKERAALLAVVLALLAPLSSLGQVLVTPDGPLLAGWTGALYFAVRALDEERGGWLVPCGLFAGLATLGKYTGLLLAPQILLALATDARGRRLLGTPWPYLGAATALLVFSPVLAWNAERHFVSFVFQSLDRLRAFAFQPVLLARFVGLQALVVSPLLWLALMVAPALAARRSRDPAYRLAAIFSLPLVALMVAIAPFHWVKANWGAPAYPGALLAAAALALERWDRLKALTLGTAALAGALAVAFHLAPFPELVPDALDPLLARDESTGGWRALAARVDAERAALGGDPLVVGCTYRPASELAYYLAGRPETQSSGVFGQDGLEFDEWLDPDRVRGRTALVVRDRREADACAARVSLCQPLEPLPPEAPARGPSRITTFDLWRCRIPADADVRRPRWRGGTR
jgi:4-amino-4-deoxy-L-arabinose transferase-like glycosyltransferase